MITGLDHVLLVCPSIDDAENVYTTLLGREPDWRTHDAGGQNTPITEFVKLSLDGREVTPKLISRTRPNGPLLNDHYHELQLRKLTPGNHTATVVVRVIATGEQLSWTISFSA